MKGQQNTLEENIYIKIINKMKIYTIEEVAEILKCSEKTVRNLIDAGKLIYKNISTADRKIIRIAEEDLRNFINKN